MNNKFANVRYLSSGLAVLIGLLGLIGLIRVLSNGIDLDDYKAWSSNKVEERAAELSAFAGSVNFLLTIVLLAIGLAVVSIIAFIIINAIKNPKRMVLPAAGVAGLLVLYGIGRAMATGRESYNLQGKAEETVLMIEAVPDGAFYFADAALITCFSMMFIAIGAIVVTEVLRRFR
jgi:hypothetical protein